MLATCKKLIMFWLVLLNFKKEKRRSNCVKTIIISEYIRLDCNFQYSIYVTDARFVKKKEIFNTGNIVH